MPTAAARPFFSIGIVLSVLLAAASVGMAVYSLRISFQAPFAIGEGLPLGNKELLAYRRGVDVRVAAVARLPVYLASQPSTNQRWGGPDHPLEVPAFDLSLWWPFALSLVLPGVHLLRRRRRHDGFPVLPRSRAT